jgi:AraC-like DNA-binding protein
MKYNSLSNLIDALEYGTKLHISVVFLSNHGNIKTKLPYGQRFHVAPVCQAEKASPAGYNACVRCRNAVLKMVVRHKRSIGGCCTKGVYEYCRPVLHDGEVACVVFIGNILPPEPAGQAALRQRLGNPLVHTLEEDFSQERCIQTADILETYILHLLQSYRVCEDATYDPLLENIKGFIGDNLRCGFFMPDLAEVFNYNEKYIGRYFKLKTGRTVREYCNELKIKQAKQLLLETELCIGHIAMQVGYNNVTYFNRIFREATGLSPKEFRTHGSKQQ